MAAVALRGVTKISSRRYVLDHVDAVMPDGKLTAIFGDRESGKLTALKVIAGIDKVTSGDIFIDGIRVTQKKSGDRNVATVFEKQGLLPHKNVFQNIMFPLRLAKVNKQLAENHVLDVAQRFGLEEVLDKRPKKLTETQRHLVGIARAVVRNPGAYLFQAIRDTSGGSIRKTVIKEMKNLVREDGSTIIYATDNSSEAFQIADKIIVMSFGEVAQSGSPSKLYNHPNHLSIAELFGSPKINTLQGKLLDHMDNIARVQLISGTEIMVPTNSKVLFKGMLVTVGVRPSQVQFEGEINRVKHAMIMQKNMGKKKCIVEFETPDGDITASGNEPDNVTSLYLPPERCMLFDPDGNALMDRPKIRKVF